MSTLDHYAQPPANIPDRPVTIAAEDLRDPDVLRAFRSLKRLVGGYLGISLLSLVAIVLLRNDTAAVNSAVWTRATIVVVSALLAAGAAPGRERDVLIAARLGATVSEIAQKLFLSEATVRNYLSAAIAKTGTRNRVEAVRTADERGWL
jgi:DNA-binding NarL/FixJ family response regulator